jgi:predicted dehydrogenase
VRVTRNIAKDQEVVEEVIPDTNPRDGHYAVIRQFLDWLDGGSPPITVLDDNLKTMALTFAAVEATHTGNRVEVASFADMIPDRLSVAAAR